MKTPNKLKIAITGNIGSGKTMFSKTIIEKGFNVINVDELSKQLLVSDKKIKDKIIHEFGEKSYSGENVNKKYLAEKVFSSPDLVLKMNSIVHPAVKKELESRMNEILKNNNIVFAEAALIYEADMEKMFDYVILITANKSLRIKRKIDIDKFSVEQFEKRELNQIPDEEKKKRADLIFENNGSIKELEERANFALKIIEGLLNTNE
jgi:dephospho-CoA kinase